MKFSQTNIQLVTMYSLTMHYDPFTVGHARTSLPDCITNLGRHGRDKGVVQSSPPRFRSYSQYALARDYATPFTIAPRMYHALTTTLLRPCGVTLCLSHVLINNLLCSKYRTFRSF